MKYRISYAHIPNMGDLLNIHVLEKVFGVKIKQSKAVLCNVSAIGSGLGSFVYSDKLTRRIIQKISGSLLGDVHVWGTGFIRRSDDTNKFYRKNMIFHAVRGDLTRKRIEKMLKKKIDIPTGDGGLLSSMLLEKKPPQKYSLGIIPHFKEQDEEYFKVMQDQNKNSKIINLREDPIEVVKQIAMCETIISSSLHGLVVADSFGIPNKHVKVSDKLLGDGYKFDDYYSAFGLSSSTFDSRSNEVLTINKIIDDYNITTEMVEIKKKQLVESFPRL